MSKADLLRQHIISPAVVSPTGQLIKGQIGQTHDELGGDGTPDANRGFIMGNGQYLQRDAARDYLNEHGAHLTGGKETLFGDGEPTSEQLRLSVPMYESPRQRIYRI